ncbi:MAG: hypothetical protein PUP93_22005 [Rhizonema sp. NSF051]|nr:hypothetical protein [Rhizonema sp. NSF051]
MSKALKLTVSTVLELAIAKNVTLTRSDNGTYHLHKGMLYLESFPQLSLCYKWLLEYQSVECLPRRADLELDAVVEDFTSLVSQQDTLVDVRLNQILEVLHDNIRAIALLQDNSQLAKESLQQAAEHLLLAYGHLQDAAISHNEDEILNLSIHDSSNTEICTEPDRYIKELKNHILCDYHDVENSIN